MFQVFCFISGMTQEYLDSELSTLLFVEWCLSEWTECICVLLESGVDISYSYLSLFSDFQQNINIFWGFLKLMRKAISYSLVYTTKSNLRASF